MPKSRKRLHARAAALLIFLAIPAFAQDLPPSLLAIRNAVRNSGNPGNEAALFQVSTLDALSQGIYGGSFTVGQLKQQGDFGVGTFAGLDGEMIVAGGHFYHMHANGVMSEAGDQEVVPFAAVTKFKSGVEFTVNQATMAQISSLIDALLPSKNFFYAIRIHGTFAAMTTRAIAMQFLPYLPLSQLIPTQSIFNYTNVTGTAVDIRSPAYVAGMNQTGHHFHFVSDDAKSGGHALSFTTGPVTVEIQTLRRYSIWLPNDEPFQNATLPIPTSNQ